MNTTSHPHVPIWGSGTKIEHKRWTRVLRWDGVVEDVDEDWPPKDERVVSWWHWLWFPPPGGKFPCRNRFIGRKSAPTLVPPWGGGAPSRKSSPYFFLGQKTLYTKRWAPEVGQGPHYPPGCARGGRRAQVPCGRLGYPSASSLFQYF